MPYQEIQALGFPNSPRKLGLYEKPWACISWYGPCTQLVNSNYYVENSISMRARPAALRFDWTKAGLSIFPYEDWLKISLKTGKMFRQLSIWFTGLSTSDHQDRAL